MRYHSYIFFDANRGTHSRTDFEGHKIDFIACVEASTDTRIHAYATLGFKAGTRFMLHINAETPNKIQRLVRDLLHTDLGASLSVTQTLFGMTRPSTYAPGREPKEEPQNAPHQYLVVYPFTKTIEWHLMPHEERRAIMMSHVEVGRKHREYVSQLLLYAYGIDDHEFIVSYYTDDLEKFQTLVMDMRGTESRRHTKNDLPIFTCIHMPLAEALTMV